MTFAHGQRIVFFAPWSSWAGTHGVVVATGRPGLWVLPDGDTQAIAARDDEVIEETDQSTLTGAE